MATLLTESGLKPGPEPEPKPEPKPKPGPEPEPTSMSPNTENTGQPQHSRYTGMKAYKFTFSFQDSTFSFIPINFYYVTATPSGNRRHLSKPYLVFIYQITMSRRDNSDVTCIVPYYISDGHTNQLRANLLFPFACFNDLETGVFCPFKGAGAFGMLYKHTPAINLELNLNHPEGYPIEQDQEQTIGLSSVLRRIENLLDFIICIGSSDFIRENIEETDLYTFRPVIGHSSLDKYNMNMIEILSEHSTYKVYRKNIIEYLAQYRNALAETGIELQPCYVIINKIDMKEFNIKYRVCGKEPLDSQLDFKKYVQISKEFFRSFKIRNLIQPTIFKNILSSEPSYSKFELKDHIYHTFGGLCDERPIAKQETVYEIDLEDDDRKPPVEQSLPLGPQPPLPAGAPSLSVGKPPSLPAGAPPLPAGPPPLSVSKRIREKEENLYIQKRRK